MIIGLLSTCIATCHCIFCKKLLLLAYFVVSKYAVFIWNTGLMQVYRYKYLQDYRKPFSSCKTNEEWPHAALPCYNENEKELFYMKCLIVDRLTRPG